MFENAKDIINYLDLEKEIENCASNNFNLPSKIRPILQFSSTSTVLIIGPAPGIRALMESHGMMIQEIN